MTKLLSLASLLCLVTASFLTAQTPAIELKLQLLPDGESWGVFAKPSDAISPSPTTITGSAQVTVVMPLDFQWANLQSHAGTWTNNAWVSGPVENPGRSYYHFGLVLDNPQIQYVSGEETLLFSFEKNGPCPDSLYLFENGSDPFGVMPNSANSNPGNEFSVLDFGPQGLPIYSYSNNYAPSAWDCHDCDGDGIPNALDSSACTAGKCVELKLEYQPAKANWAVKLRAKPGSTFTTGNVLTSASITVVAPQSFDFQNLTSKNGEWGLSGTLENPAENPGMKYLTFEMQPGAAEVNLSPWTGATLFTFKKMGDCPDSLYLMDGMTPQGLEPNEINGQGQANGQTNPLQLCGVYGLAAWNCALSASPDELPIGTGVQLQFAEGAQAAQSQAFENRRNTKVGEPARFSVSPNPATHWLDVAFENDLPEGHVALRLLNLQGQSLHLEKLLDNSRLRLDLTALPDGIYFLSLEVGGMVVQREKLVKF